MSYAKRDAEVEKARSAETFVAVCVSARERDANIIQSGVAATFCPIKTVY
jgi:hypothetical protein